MSAAPHLPPEHGAPDHGEAADGEAARCGTAHGNPGHGASERRRRMAILARADAASLEAALASLGQAAPGDAPNGAPDVAGCGWQRLRGPETGMVMVRGRMGGSGRAFNLGEMTVTRCAVRLADGRVGHAYLAGRDQRRAELAAVLDALMLDGPTASRLAPSLAAMAAAAEAAREDRARRAAATQVAFYGMVRMG